MRLLMMLLALLVATPAYAAEGESVKQDPVAEMAVADAPAETIRPRPERPAPRIDFDTRYMAPAPIANPAAGEEGARLSLASYGARF